jgi:hypothetical protein
MCLLARFVVTIPKPSLLPKPAVRRNGQFVARISGWRLFLCDTAKDPLATVVEIANKNAIGNITTWTSGGAATRFAAVASGREIRTELKEESHHDDSPRADDRGRRVCQLN